VILVAGIPDESPVALVVDAIEASGADFRIFDQRRVAAVHLALDIGDAPAGGALDGCFELDGETIPLRAITGLYLRTMDDRLLPEIAECSADAPERLHSRQLHRLLLQWADIMPGRVLNRPMSMASNMSKPYQAQTIRAAGFEIPETTITNDPDSARAFIEGVWADGGDVIYKSISGIRSIVQKLTRRDLDRLDRIRWCPTQFQRLVQGVDIRAHVIGRTVVATRIVSDGVDYRYAARETGTPAQLEAVTLEPAVEARCVALAARLDLPLAGIDLRRAADGRVVCFEVNPSPAFSFYERAAGQSIAGCIARYLAGDADWRA